MPAIVGPATTTVDGTVLLSTAPVSDAAPIAVGDNDPRMTNARTPSAHAASHAAAGGDPITISESQVTGLISDLSSLATSVASKAPSTRSISAGTGLTGGGDLSSDRTLAVSFGTTGSTACVGNDSRLSDNRTPTAHATTHKSGGSDAIKLDELAAPTDVTTLNVSTAAHGLAPKLPNDASKFLDGTGAYSTPVDATKIAKSTITQAGGLLLGTGAAAVTELAPSSNIGYVPTYDNSTNKIAYQPPWAMGDQLRCTSGALASNFDRIIASVTTLAPLTSGTLYLARIYLPKGLTVTGIRWFKGSNGITTPTNQWFGLFDSSFNKLAVTADDTSTGWGGGTAKSLNLASSYQTTYAGVHYIGLMIASGGAGNMRGASLPATSPQSDAPYLAGNSSTGLTNPASCPATVTALASASTSLCYGEVY